VRPGRSGALGSGAAERAAERGLRSGLRSGGCGAGCGAGAAERGLRSGGCEGQGRGKGGRRGRGGAVKGKGACYSHSMVAGGLLVTSRTTRLISGTSLVIRVEIRASTSSGSRAQSAVIASSLVTGRSTTGWP
jgi:hypothetical protein